MSTHPSLSSSSPQPLPQPQRHDHTPGALVFGSESSPGGLLLSHRHPLPQQRQTHDEHPRYEMKRRKLMIDVCDDDDDDDDHDHDGDDGANGPDRDDRHHRQQQPPHHYHQPHSPLYSPARLPHAAPHASSPAPSPASLSLPSSSTPLSSSSGSNRQQQSRALHFSYNHGSVHNTDHHRHLSHLQYQPPHSPHLPLTPTSTASSTTSSPRSLIEEVVAVTTAHCSSPHRGRRHTARDNDDNDHDDADGHHCDVANRSPTTVATSTMSSLSLSVTHTANTGSHTDADVVVVDSTALSSTTTTSSSSSSQSQSSAYRHHVVHDTVIERVVSEQQAFREVVQSMLAGNVSSPHGQQQQQQQHMQQHAQIPPLGGSRRPPSSARSLHVDVDVDEHNSDSNIDNANAAIDDDNANSGAAMHKSSSFFVPLTHALSSSSMTSSTPGIIAAMTETKAVTTTQATTTTSTSAATTASADTDTNSSDNSGAISDTATKAAVVQCDSNKTHTLSSDEQQQSQQQQQQQQSQTSSTSPPVSSTASLSSSAAACSSAQFVQRHCRCETDDFYTALREERYTHALTLFEALDINVHTTTSQPDAMCLVQGKRGVEHLRLKLCLNSPFTWFAAVKCYVTAGRHHDAISTASQCLKYMRQRLRQPQDFLHVAQVFTCFLEPRVQLAGSIGGDAGKSRSDRQATTLPSANTATSSVTSTATSVATATATAAVAAKPASLSTAPLPSTPSNATVDVNVGVTAVVTPLDTPTSASVAAPSVDSAAAADATPPAVAATDLSPSPTIDAVASKDVTAPTPVTTSVTTTTTPAPTLVSHSDAPVTQPPHQPQQPQRIEDVTCADKDTQQQQREFDELTPDDIVYNHKILWRVLMPCVHAALRLCPVEHQPSVYVFGAHLSLAYGVVCDCCGDDDVDCQHQSMEIDCMSCGCYIARNQVLNALKIAPHHTRAQALLDYIRSSHSACVVSRLEQQTNTRNVNVNFNTFIDDAAPLPTSGQQQPRRDKHVSKTGPWSSRHASSASSSSARPPHTYPHSHHGSPSRSAFKRRRSGTPHKELPSFMSPSSLSSSSYSMPASPSRTSIQLRN